MVTKTRVRVRKKTTSRTPQEINDTEKIDKARKSGKRDESVRDAEERIIAKYKSRIKNPTTAIRSHCVECMGGSVREVSKCTAPDCSLYPFRMGTNVMDMRASEEYKQKLKNRKKNSKPTKKRVRHGH